MTETLDVQTFTIDGFDIEVTHDEDTDRLTVTLIHDGNDASTVDQQVAAVTKVIREWREAVTVTPVPGQTYEAANGGQYLCLDNGDLVNLTPPHAGDRLPVADQPRWTKRMLKPVVMSIRTAQPVHGPYALGGLYHPAGYAQSATNIWRRTDGGWVLAEPDNTVSATYTDEQFGNIPMAPVERIT